MRFFIHQAKIRVLFSNEFEKATKNTDLKA